MIAGRFKHFVLNTHASKVPTALRVIVDDIQIFAWGFEILIIKIILGALTYLRFNKPKGELLALPYLLPTFG